MVDRWCDERAGLVLVTGASGSGKSTTLASMAQAIAPASFGQHREH